MRYIKLLQEATPQIYPSCFLYFSTILVKRKNQINLKFRQIIVLQHKSVVIIIVLYTIVLLYIYCIIVL